MTSSRAQRGKTQLFKDTLFPGRHKSADVRDASGAGERLRKSKKAFSSAARDQERVEAWPKYRSAHEVKAPP